MGRDLVAEFAVVALAAMLDSESPTQPIVQRAVSGSISRDPPITFLTCEEGELVSRVHTLVAGVVQVYHRLQVVEEEDKGRKVEQEVEREDQGEETARMTMHMEMT